MTLNKTEFRDAVKFRYDWEVPDVPSVLVCEDHFHVDHAMLCKEGGFAIERHNELRDLEAERLKIKPVLREITREELNRGGSYAPGCAAGYGGRKVLGEAEVGFLRCENLPPKCRLLLGYGSIPDLQTT